MGQPTDPVTRALQRVRDRHTAGPDGNCLEDGKPWPCPTSDDIDGDHEDETTALVNKLRAIVTAADTTPPDDLAKLKKQVKDAIGNGDTPAPNPQPGGGAGGGIRQEPPLDQSGHQR